MFRLWYCRVSGLSRPTRVAAESFTAPVLPPISSDAHSVRGMLLVFGGPSSTTTATASLPAYIDAEGRAITCRIRRGHGRTYNVLLYD